MTWRSVRTLIQPVSLGTLKSLLNGSLKTVRNLMSLVRIGMLKSERNGI